MNRREMPAPRLAPLPPSPDLKDLFLPFEKSLGFIPNSALIMQRRPKILRAFSELLRAINGEEGELDRGFKRLLSHVASRAAGCRYCMAHTAGGALRFGVDEAKLAGLTSEKVCAYLKRGMLAMIYAHLISLQSFLAIANRTGEPAADVSPWWAK